MKTKYLEVGKIVNTQGIKGEVRCISFTDDIKRFSTLKEIYIEKEDVFKTLEIENLRYHKQFVVIKFLGIDDMTSAEKLKNFIMKIDIENAIPLEEDEYFIGDLYDMEVFDEKQNKIGFIKDILFTGANDVYIVKRVNKKDLLIPAIKQCILSVNPTENKMVVKLLDGLDI
ncbi:MAG: ribosome maturation factor RimM [Lachnospirales bacterium]